jgi:hypothetical protein
MPVLINETVLFLTYSISARVTEKLIPTNMTAESLILAKDPLWEALIRLAVNITALFIIIKLIYNRYSDKKGNLFSFFLMGTVIFMVCILLKDVELQMGMALGLFAVFSIIRYRTRNMAIKDMSYLFTVIGVSAINALLDYPHPVRGTILVNSIIILTIFLLEIAFKKDDKKKKKEKGHNKPKKETLWIKHKVLYDNLELLNPDKMDLLIKDISGRTGISIEKAEICKIDLVKGNAELEVSYRGENPDPESLQE